MKTSNFSIQLILILLILGAISFTSCKKNTLKDNTTKKEEQVTKPKNGDEFVGVWSYEYKKVLKIIKNKELFILSIIDEGYKDYTYAYKYEDGSLKGNEIIFYNSVKDCIYFKGEECRRIEKQN